MRYYFKPSAVKDLKKLPKNIQQRIINKLDFYISRTDFLKFAKSMHNVETGKFRFRVGDYRIIFDIIDDDLIILVVGHRKDIYK